MRSADVVVLGAGPAGLAAALLAARRGHEVVVLERAPVTGGMAASFEVAGVRVDHGSHRLHPSIDPVILGELQRLLGDTLQWRPRHGRIRLAGRWIAFPLRAGDLVRRLPPSFALRAGVDALTAPLRRPRADTFAEVVRAGLGPTMGERFYFPYARKLWGEAPEDLAGEQARRRISAATPGALLRKVAGRRGRGAGAAGGRGFWYPAGGFGAIVDALTHAAVDAGVEVRTATTVTGVTLAGDAGGGGGGTISTSAGAAVEASHIWSTLPLTTLARMVAPVPPAAVLDAAGRLTFRSLVLAYLVVDRRRWTEFDAHYFPLLDTPASRISEPRNYREGPDPADRTVLCAELPCTVGDRVWSASPDELGALVAATIAAQGLPPVEPSDVAVRRLATAYPVYRAGFEPHLATLDGWASALDGVVTLGRHGLYAHDNTHHALAMGWAAAGCLADDGTFDRAAWAAARDRFATHVVED